MQSGFVYLVRCRDVWEESLNDILYIFYELEDAHKAANDLNSELNEEDSIEYYVEMWGVL